MQHELALANQQFLRESKIPKPTIVSRSTLHVILFTQGLYSDSVLFICCFFQQFPSSPKHLTAPANGGPGPIGPGGGSKPPKARLCCGVMSPPPSGFVVGATADDDEVPRPSTTQVRLYLSFKTRQDRVLSKRCGCKPSFTLSCTDSAFRGAVGMVAASGWASSTLRDPKRLLLQPLGSVCTA